MLSPLDPHLAALTFAEKLGVVSARAAALVTEFLDRKDVPDVQHLEDEEVTSLSRLMRANGIREIAGHSIDDHLDAHLDIHNGALTPVKVSEAATWSAAWRAPLSMRPPRSHAQRSSRWATKVHGGSGAAPAATTRSR